MSDYSIFTIPIDTISREEVEDRVGDILAGDAFRRIATVNPEFLVRARRDMRFRENLLSSDLRIPDGFGVVLDGLLSERRIERYPGTDLLHFVLAEAEKLSEKNVNRRQEHSEEHGQRNAPFEKKGTRYSEGGISIFLLIRKDGLSSLAEIANAIAKRYPKLSVEGAEIDVGVDSIPDKVRNATVVFCNFGAPEQEYVLESLRKDPGDIRIAMGIGGAFDYMTGKRKRAPKWMRAIGLEWLFRLAVQPGRIGRIRTAVGVFPFLCLSDRMKSGNKNR
jgi:N-acetylglucosaminyldiphosphoundecaprenol N-acetyl-beta-D-mannosaminyltransferase